MKKQLYYFFFVLLLAMTLVFPVHAILDAPPGEVTTYSQLKTKGECESEQTKISQNCIERAKAANNGGELSPQQEAECSIARQLAYSECMKDAAPEEMREDPEAGYQIPSADSLNQFQGLTAQQVIGNLIKTAMGVMGSLAFVIMIFAGVMWMTAGGNSDRERKAKDMMVWAALGVIVILSSYTIVRFVLDAFTN